MLFLLLPTIHVNSQDLDRLCLSRLFEHNMIFNGKRKADSAAFPPGYGVVGDTSQVGNWSCFRNCLYKGLSVLRIFIVSVYISPVYESLRLLHAP